MRIQPPRLRNASSLALHDGQKKALNRTEFLACLVHLAIHRFVLPSAREKGDVAAAVPTCDPNSRRPLTVAVFVFFLGGACAFSAQCARRNAMALPGKWDGAKRVEMSTRMVSRRQGCGRMERSASLFIVLFYFHFWIRTFVHIYNNKGVILASCLGPKSR